MKGRIDSQFRHPSEQKAVVFLEKKGHRLLRHNFHVGFCEIDLITIDTQFFLHAIEVKAWKNMPFVHPLESFKKKQIHNYQKAMELFLAEALADPLCLGILKEQGCPFSIDNLSVSFDLVWVRSDRIEIHPALF